MLRLSAPLVELLEALREGRKAVSQQLKLVIETDSVAWAKLIRLQTTVDDYASQARRLQQELTEQDADADLLDEVAWLREHFEVTADLISQRTWDAPAQP